MPSITPISSTVPGDDMFAKNLLYKYSSCPNCALDRFLGHGGPAGAFNVSVSLRSEVCLSPVTQVSSRHKVEARKDNAISTEMRLIPRNRILTRDANVC